MLTFVNLFAPGQRPKVRIENCAALLPNRMRCPKGGTWQVTDDAKNTVSQYCTMHAKLLEQEAIRTGVKVTNPSAVSNWPEGAVGQETAQPSTVDTTAQSVSENKNDNTTNTTNTDKSNKSTTKPSISPK